MKFLAILMVSACAALPTLSDFPETETTISTIQEERAGQNDLSTTAVEKGFIDELFEGVADAVTSGALSPLSDVALKPLVSALGGSVLEQIFSAANEIINEWKRSKHHNFEAHPVFIPDRGSFILVSADWTIPESPIQDNIEEKEITTENILEDILIKTTEKNNEDNETTVKNPEVELNITEQISHENNTKVNNINATIDNETLSLVKNEDQLSLNSVNFNITDDLESVAELDINNEIERRSIPENQNTKIVTLDNDKDIQKQIYNRKGKLLRFETESANWKRIEIKTSFRQAKLLNKDIPNIPEVISLKNVYLVPVQGDVDWTRGEEEFEALQEAVKAVMVTRKVAEDKQKMIEQLLGEKLRQLANSLNP